MKKINHYNIKKKPLEPMTGLGSKTENASQSHIKKFKPILRPREQVTRHSQFHGTERTPSDKLNRRGRRRVGTFPSPAAHLNRAPPWTEEEQPTLTRKDDKCDVSNRTHAHTCLNR